MKTDDYAHDAYGGRLDLPIASKAHIEQNAVKNTALLFWIKVDTREDAGFLEQTLHHCRDERPSSEEHKYVLVDLFN